MVNDWCAVRAAVPENTVFGASWTLNPFWLADAVRVHEAARLPVGPPSSRGNNENLTRGSAAERERVMRGRSGKIRRGASAGDLSKGVIVVLSGGFVDEMNPQDVLDRMDDYIADVNADPYVQAHTNGKGLKFKLLENQVDPHIHQAEWRKIVQALETLKPSPLILVGHATAVRRR